MVRGYTRSCSNSAVRRRATVLAIGAISALVIAAAPALAAPEWGITMTHANAYGLQAGECPGGKEISVPGEPEKDCGVDPFTGSGTTFARESGFNTYTIKVRNTAAPVVVGPPHVGGTAFCTPGSWSEEPTFSYQWLRNGIAIVGAESDEYTVTTEDEGVALQCEVTGTGESGAAMIAATAAVSVAPTPATAPPIVSGLPEVTRETPGGEIVNAEGTAGAIGKARKCTPGTWSASPTFSYRWLRNGIAIAGANGAEYTLAAEDEGTALACQVTASNAGGSVVAENPFPVWVETEPTTPQAQPPGPAIEKPSGAAANEITGPVTVAGRLPEGLALAGTDQASEVSGTGWTCTIANDAVEFTCRRVSGREALAPGAEYGPIVMHVRVNAAAAGSVVNVAAVSGGGAATASVSDPTTIAPAAPFGIQSFTTSVTGSLGEPFTQAAGHPVAANATFVFNNTVNDAGYLETAGGTPKDIETELPPGFIGDPQNATQCTVTEYLADSCPRSSVVGFVDAQISPDNPGSVAGGVSHPFTNGPTSTTFVYDLVPPPGTPAEFSFEVSGTVNTIDAALRSDGDYGITIGDEGAAGKVGGHGLQALSLTLCGYGVTGEQAAGGQPASTACAPPGAGKKPFLTNPAQCTGSAPTTTLLADTYEAPASFVSKTVYTGAGLIAGAPGASESFVTGCNDLQFAPEVEFKPSPGSEGGTTQADEPTGASFALKVTQTNEAGVNATPELKDATVTLPAGMTVDPSAANGLQACSNAEFGLGSTAEPAEPAACPLASRIGTAKVVTPLLEKPLEGQVFVGEPECSPCDAADAEGGHIFRLFLQIRAPERGVIVKLAGHVSANPATGQLQATFAEQPQLPFSELLLTFDGGPRAPLANPQTCGTFTTTTDLTPWSASGLGGPSGTEAIAGTPDVTPSSSFAVDWNGAGGACPAMGFGPSFSAGSQTQAAGASSPFSVTLGREDREQDISGVTVTTPPGLLGKIAGVERCPEAQADAGTCGPASEIGSTTVGAGPGPDPFYLGGNVYLTGPTLPEGPNRPGAPFGLSIVVPAVAGPFNLGNVVVRAAIAVNPSTAALTITSDPLPQLVDGVQLRLRAIHVEINRPGFMLSPTSCARQAVGATIAAAQGASSTTSSPYQVGGCSSLPFAPKLTASTQGKTSKAGGASLTVSVASAPGEANIAKVDLELPKALPSRLTTLQHACAEAQFAANPAGCPAASEIGTASAVTPILNGPLTGPAYLVSHGGAAFPDVEFVLQGEGVEIVLDGKTDIKDGVTYSRFETVPDAPIGHFEATLPEGTHSILATDIPASAHGSLCGRTLTIPTILTGQNGKQLRQSTRVAVTGCGATRPLTRAQQLARALKQCQRHEHRKVRAACERQARKRYGPKPKTAKAKKTGTKPANGRGRKQS